MALGAKSSDFSNLFDYETCKVEKRRFMKTSVFQDNPNAEERLKELRNRDLELAKISLGLQMRTRISRLEHENRVFRKMEGAWILSRFSRLYFLATRFFSLVLSKIRK
jgi:hypothetical protein